MKTRYEQIVDVSNIASSNSRENISEIISYAKSENMKPASQDKKRTLLLAIDVQNDFMEGIGSLAVDGSKGDVERLTRWMYTNINKLSQVMCSLDSHSISQIFFADWWIDQNGNFPAPFTNISYQDVVDSKWLVANGETNRSLAYLKNLEQTGKKQLCIWPYHCLTGTDGAKLESEFIKMVYYHSAARKVTPIFIPKGQDPYTEMYGIIKAEYDPAGYINRNVLDAVELFDEVYIAGQASSHCVLASTIQILEYFGNRKDITSRITLLDDCMSPIAGFEESTTQQYLELEKEYGIRLKKSTDVIL